MGNVRGKIRLAGVALAVGAMATSGCFLFAAGAGAGGAIYLTSNGAESLVSASVDKTFDATRQTFQALGITESKTSTQHEGAVESRTLEGKTSDRDVSVDLKTEGAGTKVEVTVKKSAVTWDKDFAKEILGRIVEEAK